MSANTIEANRQRHDFQRMDEIWLFAYGSLLHKIDFPCLDQQAAHISGWQRRFWQGSHDHRGTPDAPGRVLTLVEAVDALCHGLALRVEAQTFEHLDHREKNGYLRHDCELHFASGQSRHGIVYIAEADNSAWLGPASDSAIARQIAASVGPSGPNADYLLQLAAALRSLKIEDAHVFAIERALLAISD